MIGGNISVSVAFSEKGTAELGVDSRYCVDALFFFDLCIREKCITTGYLLTDQKSQARRAQLDINLSRFLFRTMKYYYNYY